MRVSSPATVPVIGGSVDNGRAPSRVGSGEPSIAFSSASKVASGGRLSPPVVVEGTVVVMAAGVREAAGEEVPVALVVGVTVPAAMGRAAEPDMRAALDAAWAAWEDAVGPENAGRSVARETPRPTMRAVTRTRG